MHIGRPSPAHHEVICHASGEHLHALKSYLPLLGMLCANNPNGIGLFLSKIPLTQESKTSPRPASLKGFKQTKTYGLVFSLYAVNRVGSFHSPTLLYQQTNRYAVVSKRVLGALRANIIYTTRGGFSYIGRSPLAYREMISHASGGHLLQIVRSSVTQRKDISHASKFYLPPIGNAVRKQYQRPNRLCGRRHTPTIEHIGEVSRI